MTSITPLLTGNQFERNLSSPFFDRARRRPGATALIFENQELTYADLVSQIDATIELLKSQGIQPGDRVAYLGWNHPMLIVSMLAAARIGAVFLPVNPRSAAAECAYILNDCTAKAVLAGAEFMPLIDEIRSDLQAEVFLTIGQQVEGWVAANVSDLRGDSAVSQHEVAGTQADDLAILLYTSGTTGRPKGVMLSHDNVWTASLNMMFLIQPTASSTLLGMAPMFHVAALALAIASFATGGKLVALPAFRPDAVFEAIQRWGVTWTFGVPTMLQALQMAAEFESADLRGMLVLAAGAPVPVALLKTWGEAGVGIVQGYGQTEATGGTSLLDANMAEEKLGSAGLPFPLTEIQLREVESDNVIADPDTEGQIWIRGRNITKGYWGLTEETGEAFDDDGWFATGDLGRYDDDGYLFIVDRLKDMIISGGVNIYPAEVEHVLSNHPNVAAVAVVGVPDEHWGELVTAAIVSKDGQAVALEDIQAFSEQSLGSYKSPRRIEMLDELPVNASGKILKRALRERFSASAQSGD